MDDFERLLQNALQREDPPAGFEQRIVRAASRPRLAWRAWAAIAATLVIAGDLGWQYEQSRRERAAGEAAKAQLEIALKITGAKLYKIQQTVHSINEEGF